MKLFKKVLSAALSLGMIFSFAFFTNTFAGGDDKSESFSHEEYERNKQAEHKYFSFAPPNCIRPQTEFTKTPRIFDGQYAVVPEDSYEYVRFDSPIEWKYFLGRLTTKIWGINKTNLEENEWGIIAPPSGAYGATVKSPEQIKNEELLIRGILEDNVEMVRSALGSQVIDKGFGIIDKSWWISVVTDKCKAKRFNVIEEALRKNNAEIISLLRSYQVYHCWNPNLVSENYQGKIEERRADMGSYEQTNSWWCTIM